MNQQLRDAIKEVAEYMGRKVDAECEYFEEHHTNQFYDMPVTYHTSADALLEVWRKVCNEAPVLFAIETHNILIDIGNNNLPEAVIKLAGIIKQIKQK